MQTEIYRQSLAHKPQFETPTYEHFEVEPITGALGAEVFGLDVATQLGKDSVADDLRLALSRHMLLLFRDQQLDTEGLRRFAELFGSLQVNPVVKKENDAGDVMLVRQEAHEQYNFSGNWHSDVTWHACPSGETALYAVEIPPCGGDTHFANTALAYDALSPELKTMLGGLRAVHQLERSQREFSAKKPDDADMTGEQASVVYADHPVVRRHPVTGEGALFVNEQFTSRFLGMTEDESRSLLDTLCRHQVRPDFTCRVRWRKGTLAIWDNRSTIHYANNDYPNMRRIMMRVSTVGEEPVGL